MNTKSSNFSWFDSSPLPISIPISKDGVSSQNSRPKKNATFSSTIQIANESTMMLKNKWDNLQRGSIRKLKPLAREKKTADVYIPKVSLIPNTYNMDDHNDFITDSRQYFTDIEKDQQTVSENDSKTLQRFNIESFLDYESLRHLRRELTPEIVEFELDTVRKTALQEALKTVPKFKSDCKELQTLKQEIKLPNLDMKFVLSLPRMFTRSGARFELPMDSRTLCGMTPIEYLTENVFIDSTRKLLYNCIFKIFKSQKIEDAMGNEIRECDENKLLGSKLPDALGVVMGEKLMPRQINFLRKLIGWYDNDEYDFKAFCSISAFCERVLAKEFSKSLLNKGADSCQYVERLDFETLERKLKHKKIDKRLVRMLHLIKES